MSDSSIKAVQFVAAKVASYLEELIDKGLIAGDQDKLREMVRTGRLNLKTVVACDRTGGSAQQGTFLNFIIASAYADAADSCTIRFLGAEELYSDYKNGIRITPEQHAELNRRLAAGFLEEANQLFGDLENYDPDSENYKNSEKRLKVVLGYFALCSDDKTWGDFVKATPFLKDNPDYVDIAQSYRLTTDAFFAKYGYFAPVNNDKAQAVAELKKNNLEMYDTFVKGAYIFSEVDGKRVLSDVNNPIDGMIFLLATGLKKKSADGKIIPFLTDDEKASAIDIAANNFAFEETKLPSNSGGLLSGIRGLWRSSSDPDAWNGVPPDDTTLAVTNSVRDYIKASIFPEISFSDVRSYVKEHDRALGGWMPYVEDVTGGTWDFVKTGTVVAWDGTKYVVGGTGSVIQYSFETGVDWTAAGVRVVYSKETGDSFRTYALAAEAPIKQTVQFGWGVTTGLGDGAGGIIGGTGDLIGNGYYYGAYGDYRDTVNTTVANGVAYVWNNPEDFKTKVTGAFEKGIDKIYSDGVAAYDKGELGYYLGHGTGEGLAIVGSFVLAPETVAGKADVLLDGSSALMRGERLGELVAVDRTGAAGDGFFWGAREAESPAGGTKLPEPAWSVKNLESQTKLVQSGEETCGAACAGYLAQSFGFNAVTEGRMIDLVGDGVTEASKLAENLSQETGKVFVGGAFPRQVPEADVARFVNGVTGDGSQPVMALFYGANASLKEGHWVVVEGMTAARDVSILDPAGLSYTMTESAFYSAWRGQIFLLGRPR